MDFQVQSLKKSMPEHFCHNDHYQQDDQKQQGWTAY